MPILVKVTEAGIEVGGCWGPGSRPRAQTLASLGNFGLFFPGLTAQAQASSARVGNSGPLQEIVRYCRMLQHVAGCCRDVVRMLQIVWLDDLLVAQPVG